MDESKIIEEKLLSGYLSGNTYADKAKALIAQQKDSWNLVRNNYSDLEKIEKKVFEFDNFKIVVQFNPGRIVSSSAKVDSKSINDRPCFLCMDNLPSEQKGILYNNEYLILVNPFPIFEEHFTIPTLKHQPQQIANSFHNMLNLAEDLGKYYTVFYNGPKCGASAPDHLHFQACTKSVMPIENELKNLLSVKGNMLYENNEIAVYGISNYLRNFFMIECNDKQKAVLQFEILLKIIKSETGVSDEPMMNIIVLFNGKWKVLVFSRAKHRPSQYFLEGENRILISPAAVDFGGQLITPREEDFNNITKDDIVDIFSQTTLSDDLFNRICKKFSASSSG
ncbi:putative glycosyltransferase - possibly involved in cell wall localization and side chain formation of rhamnose-glucose polysaccharide [hydrothermal vent metagenome]|uniref:GDP-D-glucose phosphorylase 1 n=1 Tax=hydrothermal vent metagenome TaxID=652676 RepID=A0A3B1C8D5_9ZZZZ